MVRRYVYKREEDLGDVRLDERMTHRTEGVAAGRREAGSVKHKNTRRHYKKHHRKSKRSKRR